MGRKSLAEERTNQILDAFERCIIEHGVEGATLQRTADLSKVNLGMIHHYIGRKDDLLQTMIDRLLKRTQAEMAQFDKFVPDAEKLTTLLDEFFSVKGDQNDKIIDALYTAGNENQTVNRAIEAINRLYLSIWTQEIGRLHPSLPQTRCEEIGLAVLGLAYSRDLLPFPSIRKAIWRESAEILINHPHIRENQ